LYLVGRFAGALGTLVQSVAVGWHVYDFTNSTFALGMVGLAQFLPMVLVTLPAGDLADRADRRVIVAAAAGVQALSAGLLLALTWGDITLEWAWYAALFVFGVARAVMAPASRSFVPLLVPEVHLPRAVAISSTSFQAAVILGPAVGGALMIAGPTAAYLASGGLFLLSAASVALIRAPARVPQRNEGESTLKRVLAGVAFLQRSRLVFGAVSLDLFAVLLGGATALLPVFARDILMVGPLGLGVLRAAPAVGALVVNLWLVVSPPRRYNGAWLFASIAAFGLSTLLFAATSNFWVALAALALIGGTDMVSVYLRSALVPLATPREVLGRVAAVEMLFIGASNELGEFESGLTAWWFGTVRAVWIGGLGTLGVVGLWAWAFPELRRIDRLEDIRPPP
jgi:hypothetical protein